MHNKTPKHLKQHQHCSSYVYLNVNTTQWHYDQCRKRPKLYTVNTQQL